MNNPVVVISGPMTGHQDFNRSAFNAMATKLNAQGFTVLTPAILPDGLVHQHYLDITLAMVDRADAICMLPGWQHSNGAVQEFDRAKMRGLLFLPASHEALLAIVDRMRRQRGTSNDIDCGEL